MCCVCVYTYNIYIYIYMYAVYLETEKYAHVTFFFNGGLEKAHPKEDRHLVPSPKVATYDLQPEMSVDGVATAVSLYLECTV